MNATRLRSLIAVAFVVSPATGIAQGKQDRLLPESFTRAVAIQWKQDGRVVDVTLTNPKDKWLITEATLTVEYPVVEVASVASAPSKKHEPAKRADGKPTLDDLLAQGYRYIPEPTTYKVKLQLFPGRRVATHIELLEGGTVSGLRLDETRGREPTAIERLKLVVQQ